MTTREHPPAGEPAPGPLPVDGRLRPVEDADAEALTALVAAAYADHPGCVLDLDGVDADLTAPASAFAADGGQLVVVEAGDALIASVGWVPAGPSTVELERLYVHARVRRRGVGTWLVRWVEARARRQGAEIVELWSDTRFSAAHRLYRRLGYTALDETRELDDPSDTTERRFRRRLDLRGAGTRGE